MYCVSCFIVKLTCCLLLGHFTSSYGSQLCDHLPHPSVLRPVSLSQTAFTLCASFPVYQFVLVPCDCVPNFESVKLLIVSSLPLPASANPFMFMMGWDSSGNWVFSLLISPSLCSAWTAWTAQRWTWQTLNQCALPLRHSHNRFTITKRSVFSVRN